MPLSLAFLFFPIFQENWEHSKHCIKFVLNNYESGYATLLKKKNAITIEIKRLCTLAIEIFKIINNNNLSFISDIFTPKRDRKFAKYGDKNLVAVGLKIWN